MSNKLIVCITSKDDMALMSQQALLSDNYEVVYSIADAISKAAENVEFSFYRIESLCDEDRFSVIEAVKTYITLYSSHFCKINFVRGRIFGTDNILLTTKLLFDCVEPTVMQLSKTLAAMLDTYMFTMEEIVPLDYSVKRYRDPAIESNKKDTDKQLLVKQIILKESKDFWGEKKDNEIYPLLNVSRAYYYKIKKMLIEEVKEEELL